jgi:phosphoribosylformimino-5-aminoimidazole carboxamide ribotide isomerase
MIAIPAIDLREGACVQLVGGRYESEAVRLDDPVEVATSWGRIGFRRLHVVDLDAATGRGDNSEVVDEILRRTAAAVQVGGGIRSHKRIEALLDAGASCAIVGTRALTDARWLAEATHRNPGRLVVAVDVKEGKVAVKGWTARITTSVEDTIRMITQYPIAGIFMTAVDVEGRMEGPDMTLAARVASLTSLPVTIAGGIASLRNLRELRECGVASAVVGMALYTGAIDARALAEEFGQ